MKTVAKALLVLIGIDLALAIWFWDSAQPVVRWEGSTTVGKSSAIRFEVADRGKGLSRVRFSLLQGERRLDLREAGFTAGIWPWGTGPDRLEWTLDLTEVTDQISLGEGDFQVEVQAVDQGNLFLFSRDFTERYTFTFDSTPPRIEIISKQHYLRQGGSEAVLYRVDEGGTSGVRVADRLFVGYPLSWDEGLHVALFALEWNQPTDTPVTLWAVDQAGNEVRAGFWLKTLQDRFRTRRVTVTDALINRVVPEIISRSPQASEQSGRLEKFLEVNDRLRDINDRQIAEITKQSTPSIQWGEPFLQLSRSQVESHFADQRSYVYGGEVVDRQTHLGFDLASVANSPIEASNAGVVAYAGYLGIYGNCLIIDHGLGLFSLYGHLSSFEVGEGDVVARGQKVGSTGQTGLAAGDHLHFTMIVQGVQVNPLEWWDGSWVRQHFLSRVQPPEPVN